MIALELEASLHRVFVAARNLRYATISLEQLLLALLDNPRAADVLRTCAIDVEAMRTSVSAIVQNTALAASGGGPVEPAESPEFQRVLQRAIARVLALRNSPGQLPNASKTFAWVPAFFWNTTEQLVVDGGDILLENDNLTPMEFVVDILPEHLGLTLASAVRIMLQVHHEGR